VIKGALRERKRAWNRSNCHSVGGGARRPQIGHRSKRFDELDHSTTLTGIGQRAAHRAGIVHYATPVPGRDGAAAARRMCRATAIKLSISLDHFAQKK
jgi:hypothetical protein